MTIGPRQTINLSPAGRELWLRAKAAAALEGITLNRWLERSISEALDGESEAGVLRGIEAQLTESLSGESDWPNAAGWRDILGDVRRALAERDKETTR